VVAAPPVARCVPSPASERERESSARVRIERSRNQRAPHRLTDAPVRLIGGAPVTRTCQRSNRRPTASWNAQHLICLMSTGTACAVSSCTHHASPLPSISAWEQSFLSLLLGVSDSPSESRTPSGSFHPTEQPAPYLGSSPDDPRAPPRSLSFCFCENAEGVP